MDELTQKKNDLRDKLSLIAELQDEAAELAREINEMEDRAKEAPGVVRQFRPRPSNGPKPTDQGSQ